MTRIRIFFAALLLVGWLPSEAALYHDRNLDWFTISTPHFRVHYHNGLDELAPRAAGIAEAVHSRLTRFLNWYPDSPTDILLTDEYDVANGYATPYPSKRFVIFMSAPDRLNSLEDNGGWLETVITHEYLHVLHLDMATGIPGNLRNIFGRFVLLFPNTLQPTWFVEGLATYTETNREHGVGRGQNSYFAMLMRGEVEEGVKPVTQVNQLITSWPGYTVPYLYGVHFIQFLADRYGEERVQRWVAGYSNNLVPFLVNTNSQLVTGKSMDILWGEFIDYLQQRYPQPLLAAHPGERLTESGYDLGPLAADPAGRIVYYRSDWRRRPGLWRFDPRSGEHRRLTDVSGNPVDIDIDHDGRLLLSQLSPCHNAALYADLFRVDEEGDRHRLTHCGRYRLARWAPDGKGIAAVRQIAGRGALLLLDEEGNERETLWRGNYGDVLGDLVWGPDGETLYGALWTGDRGWDLARFDRASRQWSWLTDGRGIEHNLSLDPSGRWLYFTADYDGRYQLYRLELGDRHIESIGVSDAFHPVIEPRGEWLYYSGYGAQGFDLYRLPLAEAAGQPVAVASGDSGHFVLPEIAAPTTTPPRPYSPWATWAPHWWFPHLTSEPDRSEIGVMTAGADILDRHSYVVDLAFEIRDQEEGVRPVGSLDYLYDRGPLLWHVGVNESFDYRRLSDDSVRWVRQERAFLGEALLPLFGTLRYSLLRLGLQSSFERTVTLITPPAPAEKQDGIAGLGIDFGSATTPPRASGPEDGISLKLSLERHGAGLDSDYDGGVSHGQLHGYWATGPGTLDLRLAGGYGATGAKPFQLGGAVSSDPLAALGLSNITGSILGKRDYALRGYSDGLPGLSGHHMAIAGLSYHQPLAYIERGSQAPPLALDQLHYTLFTETGAAWDDNHQPIQFHPAAGIELHANLYAFYLVPLRLTLGYAQGFSDLGEGRFYALLGSAF